MLRFKRLLYGTVVFIVFFLNLHSAGAQWVSFGYSSEKQKPSARVLVSNESETVIEFTLEGMEVKKIMIGDETFHVLRFPDYYTTMEVGKPQLPAISELIGIPDLSNVHVSVVETEEIILRGYHVYPHQEPRLENEYKPFFIERSFYENNAYYPALDVRVSPPRIWRDARIANLR